MRSKKILVISKSKYEDNEFQYFAEHYYSFEIDVIKCVKHIKLNIEKVKYSAICFEVDSFDLFFFKCIDEVMRVYKNPIIVVAQSIPLKELKRLYKYGISDYLIEPESYFEYFKCILWNILRAEVKTENILDYQICHQSGRVFKDNIELDLYPQEKKALIYFLRNQNKVIKREEISVYLIGYESRAIDMYISKIRKSTMDPRIRSIRSKGYIFDSTYIPFNNEKVLLE